MTDNQIIELSAASIGLKGEWVGCHNRPNIYWIIDNEHVWSPLTQGQDSLQLIAHHHLSIIFCHPEIYVSYRLDGIAFSANCLRSISRNAAERRAVATVAAMIEAKKGA